MRGGEIREEGREGEYEEYEWWKEKMKSRKGGAKESMRGGGGGRASRKGLRDEGRKEEGKENIKGMNVTE